MPNYTIGRLIEDTVILFNVGQHSTTTSPEEVMSSSKAPARSMSGQKRVKKTSTAILTDTLVKKKLIEENETFKKKRNINANNTKAKATKTAGGKEKTKGEIVSI